MFDTLCLSGGGIKGLCHLSAINYFYKLGYLDFDKINKYVGTSIGSVICFILNIGHKPDDMVSFIKHFNFKVLEPDIDLEKLFESYGLDDGKKMMEFISSFLEFKMNKKDITFSELYRLTNKKIYIITTNYSKSKEVVFSIDSHPNMSVLLAIRMSISIPTYFIPVKYEEDLYIDGGIVNNFGIKYCNPETTLGIVCITKNNTSSSFMDYAMGCINVSIMAFLNNMDTNFNYVEIVTDNLKIMEVSFDISKEQKDELFELGEKCAKKYYYDFVVKNVLRELIK